MLKILPSTKAIKLVTMFLVTTIVFKYGYLVIKYSINFPYYDDFHAVLHFINSWVLNTNFNDRFLLLFSQHNEHRILMGRGFTLLSYYLNGKINFIHLIIIGNLALIVIIMVFKAILSKKDNLYLLALIPISLILFNFRYYEISFWAITSLATFWTIAFSFLSLFYLYRESPLSLYLAIAFGYLATFSMANGFLVFFAGTFVLILNKRFLVNKNYFFLVFGIFILTIYLIDYREPVNRHDSLHLLLNDPLSFIKYFLSFLGSGVYKKTEYAIPIGLGLVAFIIYLFYKKFHKENPVVFSLMVFILTTSLLTSYGRFYFGISQSLASRYSIYSTLLIISCFIAFISIFKEIYNIKTVVIFTLMAFILNYKNQKKYLPGKINYHNQFELYMSNKASQFNYGWHNKNPEIPRKIAKTSDSLKVFDFKEY